MKNVEEHLLLPICAWVRCLSEVHDGWEPCWSDSRLVVVLQKPLCHRIGDAGVSVITRGPGSPSLCFSRVTLYSHLAVFTPSIVPSRNYSGSCRLYWCHSRVSCLGCLLNERPSRGLSRGWNKERTQKTPSRCGAQSDEPNGAEKDGDEQMRRDTGLAGVIAAVCRPIRRFLSCLWPAIASSLRLFWLSFHDASPSLPSSALHRVWRLFRS